MNVVEKWNIVIIIIAIVIIITIIIYTTMILSTFSLLSLNVVNNNPKRLLSWVDYIIH